jgi:hypothetical protein
MEDFHGFRRYAIEGFIGVSNQWNEPHGRPFVNLLCPLRPLTDPNDNGVHPLFERSIRGGKMCGEMD